jgi:hypothetical protein
MNMGSVKRILAHAKNKKSYVKALRRYWPWLAFAVLTIASLAFLLFQKGIWAYVDATEETIYRPELFKDLSRYVSTLDTAFFFSHDQAQIGSYRLVPSFIETVMKAIFGLKLGQIVYYFSFFLAAFLIFRKLLSYFFNKTASSIGALVFAFNPIALFFMYIPGYLYAYLSAPFILVGFYEFFRNESKTKRYAYLSLFALGISFLFIYTRVMGIYLALLFVISLFFIKPLLKMAWRNKLRTGMVAGVAIGVLMPILVATIMPKITHEDKYFVGAGSFAQTQEKFAKGVYEAYKIEKPKNGLVLNEITQNIGEKWQKGRAFKYASAIFVLVIGFGGVALAAYKRNKLAMYVGLIFLGAMAVRWLAKFTSEPMFAKIMFKYFPFITNNTQWIYIVTVVCLSFFAAYIANYKRGKYVVAPLVVCFLAVAVVPFINFSGNDRTKLVDLDKAPQAYKQEFYSGGPQRMPSAAYIGGHLAWTPYPITTFTSKNQWVMSDNVRVVGLDQNELAASAQSFGPTGKHIENAAVLNLKKLYVYKDAASTSKDLIAWIDEYDAQAAAKQRMAALNKSPDVVKELDSASLARFGIKGNNDYEFNLYSPGRVIDQKVKDFYKKPLDIESKPMLIDNKSFGNKQSAKNLDAIAQKNPDVNVSLKESFYDQTRYYVKLTNFDPKQPLLLQLNKVYNPSWKVKWITKQDYEKIKCSAPKTYLITQNQVCEFGGNPFDVRDSLAHANNKGVAESNHFEGNYVGNAWIVNEDQLPDNAKEVYAYVVYEKQAPASISMMVSVAAIIIPGGVALGMWGKKALPPAWKKLNAAAAKK